MPYNYILSMFPVVSLANSDGIKLNQNACYVVFILMGFTSVTVLSYRNNPSYNFMVLLLFFVRCALFLRGQIQLKVRACAVKLQVYFYPIYNILFTSANTRLVRRYLDDPDILRVLQPLNARQLTWTWNRGGIYVDVQTQSRLSTVRHLLIMLVYLYSST